MSNVVKIIVYLVLLICLATFGALFISNFHKVDAPPPPTPPATNATATASTTTTTNEASAEVTPEPAPETTPDNLGRTPSKRVGHMMTYGALAFVSLLGLGLMVARDMARFFGHRAEQLLMSDDGEGLRSPEYESAEQLWANGNYLEAIQAMRDYYKENPREVHAAKRIAEIYEKDLGNPLAAALEYEEIIKLKLAPESWGWSAIHLANLYSGKLNKRAEAVELLRRIINEYGETAAAKKARERLAVEQPQPQSAAPAAPDDGSGLPPGFSLKK